MAERKPINSDVIPNELKALNQWVWWKAEPRDDGKLNKIPMDAKTGQNASHSDSSTWSPFDVAREYHENHSDSAGIGFVFSADDPYVGIDLDGCRNKDSGEIESWAAEFIELANTYSEVSPSGTGVKIWLQGVMPSERGRKKAYQTGAVEMYSHHRFFTVTGQHLEGTPTEIQHNTDAIEEIFKRVFGTDSGDADQTPKGKPSEPVTDDDQVLIEKAMNAANGDKFRRLWQGDYTDYQTPEGKPDRSRADLALCSFLAFWTQGDAVRIQHLYFQSGLDHSKMERADYRQWTMDKALSGVKLYDPNYRSGDIGTQAADDTESEVIYQKPAPVQFPECAWRGIFTLYREAQIGTTEVCEPFHFGVLKTVIGTIIGRCCYVYNGRNLYPNFYTCLIGPTRRSRKSTALRRGELLLNNADPQVIVQHGLATPEGLIASLVPSNLDDNKLVISDVERVRAESISDTEGYRLLATINEFASLLKKAAKESSSGLIQCLTDAYDAPPSLDLPTRHKPLSAKNPFVALVALSTKEWLEASLKVEDIHGGFVNRHLFYSYEPAPPIANPQKPDTKLMSTIVQQLHDTREWIKGRHIEFEFSDDSQELLEAWYNQNYEKTFGSIIVEEAVQRIDENVRKLALLYAILENDEDDRAIHLEQLEAAIEVGRYWESAAAEIFRTFFTTPTQKNEMFIYEKLREKPRTKRELQQSVGGNMSAEDFNRSLKALLDAGQLGWRTETKRRKLLVIQ